MVAQLWANPIMNKTTLWFLSVVLIALICIVYFQMHSHEFINWDDPYYIYENPLVTSGLSWLGIGWAFITGTASNWHPLTWISHMLDSSLFGPSPKATHMVTMVWYMGCVLLAFFLFLKLEASPQAAFLMAAFFGLHPLHVESVAWAAERKDVLCAFFFLAASLAYLGYARERKMSLYLWTTLLFILALLSKPMAVTWPCVALLLDYWPLKRLYQGWKQLLVEKIPWFVLTALSSLVTFIVQNRSEAVKSIGDFSLVDRLANAAISYWMYIRQSFWPFDLTVFYPYPSSINVLSVVIACCLLGGITLFVIRQRSRHPYLLWGWLFYLGVLVPVIGIIQVGAQAHADRYTLLPQLGIIIGLGLFLDKVIVQRKIRRFAGTAMFIIITILMVLTFRQVSYWKNNITLFNQNLSVTGPNELAHFNLGSAYLAKNELELSILHFTASLEMNPHDATTYNNLGLAYFRQKEITLAESFFRQAIAVNPYMAQPYFHLAIIKTNQGLFSAARDYMEKAVQLAPGWTEARDILYQIETLSSERQKIDD
jgi:hypothetical protein